MSHTIIVSDLHVDTWPPAETYGEPGREKTKLDHWRDFLNWCAEQNADELIINGDLLDAPPYKGEECFTTGPAREAVDALLAYAKNHRVTYIYGNHDIGISGLRCPAGAGIAALHGTGLLYPKHSVAVGGSVILLEHGHFYDPVLILYARDLLKRTYLPGQFEALQWVQQRRDPVSGDRIKDPGVAAPTTVDLSRGVENNIFGAILMTDFESPTPEDEKKTARSFLDRLKRGVVLKAGKAVKHYLWWEAAQDIFKRYLAQGQLKPQTLYCVMGHTHVPDTGTTTANGVKCIYLNSGTWTCAGDTPKDRSYATYLDVRETGKVWAQDWIWNR
jgi:UDP-2,3-diacylglucosamine pyrophosphatase LpxH